jgi:hypothetical protein
MEPWNQKMVKSERTKIKVIGLSLRSHRNNKVLVTLIDHRVSGLPEDESDIDYSYKRLI